MVFWHEALTFLDEEKSNEMDIILKINYDNEPFNEQVFKDKLIIENDINHINELYLEAKNKLEKKLSPSS